MENDILIDGVIVYTKEDKLKWDVYDQRDLISEYKCKMVISKSKELQIRFYCNYKNMHQSGINFAIQTGSDKITNYKYMSSSDFDFNSRFKELSDLINKKLKR